MRAPPGSLTGWVGLKDAAFRSNALRFRTSWHRVKKENIHSFEAVSSTRHGVRQCTLRTSPDMNMRPHVRNEVEQYEEECVRSEESTGTPVHHASEIPEGSVQPQRTRCRICGAGRAPAACAAAAVAVAHGDVPGQRPRLRQRRQLLICIPASCRPAVLALRARRTTASESCAGTQRPGFAPMRRVNHAWTRSCFCNEARLGDGCRFPLTGDSSKCSRWHMRSCERADGSRLAA